MVNPTLQPLSANEPTPVRVLVVDDSAFMRYTISSHLNRYSDIQVVGCAKNGVEALQMIPKLEPDVVTLDVEMPEMDGLNTLRQVMRNFPRPVIMISSLTTEGAAETIRALTLGAVDFVAKPAQKANIDAVMDEVAVKIKQAARAKVSAASPAAVLGPVTAAAPAARPASDAQRVKATRPRTRSTPIVLIGSSTGGPRALNTVIPALPADLPAAVVVVQHMPVGFTRSLADRLNGQSGLWVKEAEAGDRLEVGKVLIAPGGYHLIFNEQEQAVLTQTPSVHGVRPAVDVTLISLVKQFNRSVISVILTGMGSDGANGSALLHAAGGLVIAEDESSAVVWGMPRSVVEAGAANVVVPLPMISEMIEQAVRSFKVK